MTAIPIAVIDTSVLYGPRERRTIVAACQNARIVAVWSPHIIAELNRVLTLRWLEEHGDNADSRKRMSRSSKDMMDILTKAFELVDTAPSDDELTIDIIDADDRHLVRAARNADAAYIVSRNTRDFPPPLADRRHMHGTVEFITSSEFFSRFGIG